MAGSVERNSPPLRTRHSTGWIRGGMIDANELGCASILDIGCQFEAYRASIRSAVKARHFVATDSTWRFTDNNNDSTPHAAAAIAW
jgi:hypothetical protein